jgi:hypothetical protein
VRIDFTMSRRRFVLLWLGRPYGPHHVSYLFWAATGRFVGVVDANKARAYEMAEMFNRSPFTQIEDIWTDWYCIDSQPPPTNYSSSCCRGTPDIHKPGVLIEKPLAPYPKRFANSTISPRSQWLYKSVIQNDSIQCPGDAQDWFYAAIHQNA